jgi:hypothetical protein
MSKNSVILCYAAPSEPFRIYYNAFRLLHIWHVLSEMLCNIRTDSLLKISKESVYLEKHYESRPLLLIKKDTF